MALTNIESNLTLSNNGQAPTTPSLVIAVNADGTPISGGGGGGGGDVNVAQFGGTAVELGQNNIVNSIPVALAFNHNPIPMNLNQVGSTIFSLGQHTKTNSISVTIANDQVVSISPSGADSMSIFPIADDAAHAFGATTGWLTGFSIAAFDPVLDGGVISLAFIAATGGATLFTSTLATNATSGDTVQGLLANLQFLRIPVPQGGFQIKLSNALTSGFYQISGSFSST